MLHHQFQNTEIQMFLILWQKQEVLGKTHTQTCSQELSKQADLTAWSDNLGIVFDLVRHLLIAASWAVKTYC